MHIDWKNLRIVIHADVDVLREMKLRKHESGQPHWNGLDELVLINAKKLATIHCSIAAHARGKLHLRNRWNDKKQRYDCLSLEDQENLIKDLLPLFLLPDPPVTQEEIDREHMVCGADYPELSEKEA